MRVAVYSWISLDVTIRLKSLSLPAIVVQHISYLRGLQVLYTSPNRCQLALMRVT